jgi:hypothetical protein
VQPAVDQKTRQGLPRLRVRTNRCEPEQYLRFFGDCEPPFMRIAQVAPLPIDCTPSPAAAPSRARANDNAGFSPCGDSPFPRTSAYETNPSKSFVKPAIKKRSCIRVYFGSVTGVSTSAYGCRMISLRLPFMVEQMRIDPPCFSMSPRTRPLSPNRSTSAQGC